VQVGEYSPAVTDSQPAVQFVAQVTGDLAAALKVELTAELQAVVQTELQATIKAALVSYEQQKTVTQNFDPWTMRLIVVAGIAYAVLPYFVGRWARLGFNRLAKRGSPQVRSAK
jgi:hypothetical protein